MLWRLLLACATVTPPPTGPPEDPSWSQVDRACASAWHETTRSLSELHHDAGKPEPPWPAVDEALALCRELKPTPAAARCLDGAWYAAHSGECAATLAGTPDLRGRWLDLLEEAL